jgi:hypothetical protein
MPTDIEANLNGALSKRQTSRLAVAMWLADHPESSSRFHEYVDSFFKIRFDSNPQMGVGTLLSALKSDDEFDFGGIGEDALRRWLVRTYPDA